MTAIVALTLIYVAVLVLALATGLIAILYFLNGARSDLKRIAWELHQVNQNVEPLKGALSALNDGLGPVARALDQSRDHFAVLEAAPEKRRAGGTGTG
ncbi:MAG TPA: hypothetical protein VE131_16775 [Terriglobales bacterium]|nr:hypothetical protein [Terriglobales bacterium]